MVSNPPLSPPSECADAARLTGPLLLPYCLQYCKFQRLRTLLKTERFRVSFCAAILCTFGHEKELRVSRFIEISIFAVLYLAFCLASILSNGIGLRPVPATIPSAT